MLQEVKKFASQIILSNIEHNKALYTLQSSNIILRHDEIKLKLQDLFARALNKSSVRDEPLIHLPSTRTTASSAPANTSLSQSTILDERGDILVRGFHQPGKDTIFDVRVCDLDAKTYVHQDPAKVLEKHKKDKKRQYLTACTDQRRFFVPLVMGVDGTLEKETKATVKQLARKLRTKWDRPYSQVCGLIRSQLSVAIA